MKKTLNFAKVLNNKFSAENLNLDEFFYKVGKNVKSYDKLNYWPKTFREYLFKKIKEKNLSTFYKKMKYQIS